MKSAPIEIPKGNTQPGVLVKVFTMLSRELPISSTGKLRVFDLPCGEGEFLITFRKFYPHSDLVGLDLFARPRKDFEGQFIQSDMRDWSQVQGSSFDLVTCISGVMQCDDVQGLFEKSSKHLKPGGYLFVTNDNILTARDRFSFFLFGYVKRFRKFFGPNEGNWNVVLPQSLLRLYERHGFEDIKIEYCSLRPEDWLFFPLALPLYFLDLLYLLVAKSSWSKGQKYQMYPFLSLFARHYVFIGRLKK